MTARSDLIKTCKVSNAPQPRDTACVGQGGTDVIDELLFDELFAIPDGVEHLPHRQRGERRLPNQPESGLVFGGRGIFEPEQAIGLEVFTQATRFDGC